MKGLDTAARQMARLVGWAIDETLEKIWPSPADRHRQCDDLLSYLTKLEEDEEVFEARHRVFGSPLLPWETDVEPPTGAAGHKPPRVVDAGAGGRHHDELTWVLTVILRRHLSKNLGLAGAIAPVIAKAAAEELLHHFTVERTQ